MARKTRKQAGVIGLGIIGSRVAAALRAEGFRVFVWNRTPKPEPGFLGSPAEVAKVCDVVQIFVSDAEALFEVIVAMVPALEARHVVCCHATVGRDATLKAAEMVTECGAKFLDAPFTGSRGAAEKRQLTYYIGDDDVALAAAEPVLRASGSNIVKIGSVGQAAAVKVATNMLVGVTVQALAEALAVVRKAGIAPELLGAALEHHAVRSGLTDMKLPKMITGDYEPQFSLKNMFKDAQLAIHMANAEKLDVPVTTATAGVMFGALAEGWEDLDLSCVARIYDEESFPDASGLAEDFASAAEAKDLTAEMAAQNPELAAAIAEQKRLLKGAAAATGEPKAEVKPVVEEKPADEKPAAVEPTASDSVMQEVSTPQSGLAQHPEARKPAEEQALAQIAAQTADAGKPDEKKEEPPPAAPAVETKENAGAEPQKSVETAKDAGQPADVSSPEKQQEKPALPDGGKAATDNDNVATHDSAQAASGTGRPAPLFNRIRRFFGKTGA